MAMPAKPSTRVEIFDQVYTIGGESDAAYVAQLAERVDALMRQVARDTRLVDSLRVAVLSALNLADENERLRRELERLQLRLAEHTQAVSRRLDRLLGSAG